MYETQLTVVGNIASDPIRRRVGDHELIKFRVASNSRKRAADGSWETGNSLFVTVNCWDRLVTGVGASLSKGLPVIVIGHVFTSEYEDKDGVRRSSVELRATAVGPDLARCAARVEKIIAAGPDNPAVAARADHVDGPDGAPADSDADDDEMAGLALTP
ncbi:single-stranded DNA-binding protein [Mycolicibacter arupensis]|uniref:Single-stranded DNA-binding protein n=1 Tax=Mycolicibacter arupensis TaxID=342002 RepID=A0A0F5N323_9MYCO|nr:single-stranded DNA-binding protein [Mycolicibacter arupensis]MCV7276993.1 single-stranded DNA-binding protein [Mycolicibacter arupensis]ORA00914.1 single-stranded DNA-binding protein [Mycolicibacter arupensis]